MIESYLKSVTGSESSGIEITPLVKSLSGVIDLPPDYDYRKEIIEQLEKKHS